MNKLLILVLKQIATLLIIIVVGFFTPSYVWAQNKCGVNVGPYYDQVNQVHNLTKQGGWVVALGTLGDCAGYSNLFGKGLNVVIRAYNGGQTFNETQAVAWTATLGKLDTKGQKVYFMPWNEPNHENEGGGQSAGPASYQYTQILKNYLQEAGLLGTKVILLSPMVDKLNPWFADNSFFNGVPGGKAGYYSLAQGSSINEYDQFINNQACSAQAEANNCKYDQIGIPAPFYALESGVAGTCGKAPPCYRDSELKTMLDVSWQKWSTDNNFKMFAIFSYDPHRPGDWNIFSAPQVKSFYNSQCSAGSIDMMSGFDETKFNQWLTNNEKKLVKCNEQCGYAPKDNSGLCSGVGKDSGDIGYDASRFNNYDLKPNNFYLYPIKSLATKNRDAIRNELITEGYQAFCATPKYKLNVSLGPQEIVKKFFELGNGSITMPFNSKFVLDFTGARSPIFRSSDPDNKRFLFTSIEEFFGFVDTKDTDNASLTELYSGPANSLLSKPQRCKQSLRLLVQTKIFCEKLKNPDICALYEEKIPDTGLTYRQLLDQVLVNAALLTQKETDTPCKSWVKKYPNNKEIRSMVDAIYQVPLYLDRAYKLAFLVMSVRQKPKEDGKLFNFFKKNNEKAFQDATIAVAFKVPATGTNENLAELKKRQDRQQKIVQAADPGDVSFEEQIDPLRLTQASLTDLNKQQEEDKAKIEFIKKLKDLASVAAIQNTDDNLIWCDANSSQPDACNPKESPLGRALIDIINGQALDPDTASKMLCASPNFEESEGVIGDPVNLEIEDEKKTLFKKDFGKQILKQLFKSGQVTENELGELEFESKYQVKPNTYKQGGDTEVRFYLVYPGGMNLETIEKSLAGAFFTEEELKSLNYRDPYKREGFPLISGIKNFLPGSQSHSFSVGQEATGETQCFPDPNNYDKKLCGPVYRTKTKSFTATISDLISDPARIIGGGVGYFIRIIQLNLNPLKSGGRAYVAQCKTTEEYLLGQCGGEDVSPKYIKTNPSTIVGAYCSVQQDTVTNETINFKICKGDFGAEACNETVAPSSDLYFLDEKSPYRLKLASMVIDGATLITTGSLTPMNPGQWQKSLGNGGGNRSCGGNDKSHFEIWYIPNDVTDLELLDFNYWRNNAAKLKYHPDPDQADAKGYMNVVLNLKVKAGHYAIFAPIDSACISSKTVIVSQDGIEKEASTNLVTIGGSSLIKFDIGPTKTQYCAKLTLNSNMPGGSGTLSQVGGHQVMCQLGSPYDLTLNNACGGLEGDQQKQDDICNSDPNLLRSLIQQHQANITKYLDITGRPALPLNKINSSTCCREIFPNVLKEFDAQSCPI